MTTNNPDPQCNVYFNDHLTEYRRNLFYAARQLVKRKSVFAAWSQQGNILIRLREDDQAFHIRSHKQLMEMKLIEDTVENMEDIEDEDDD